MIIFTIILFALFSPLAFLWDWILTTVYLLKTKKSDKIFDSIVKDEEEEEVEEDDKVQLSVAIIEDKAYWVIDNTFYVAEVINGEVDRSSSRPVDPFTMSASEIKKMLFILDNIVEG